MDDTPPLEALTPEPATEPVAADQAATGAQYVLIMFYTSRAMIAPQDVFSILEEVKKIREPRDVTSIDVILNCRGGDIYSAYHIIHVLREHCSSLRMVIPFHAMSAATLMALGGDRIVMAPQSRMGPLDLPMEHPLTEGTRISALDGVQPMELLASVARDLAFKLGRQIRQEIQLGRRDSIHEALHFAQAYISPVVSKLDPSLVNLCYRELEIAERYAREFLADYMFREKENCQELARDVANSLVWTYPAHDFAIGSREARRLQLEVCEHLDYGDWPTAWAIFEKLRESLTEDQKAIRLLSLKEARQMVASGSGAKRRTRDTKTAENRRRPAK